MSQAVGPGGSTYRPSPEVVFRRVGTEAVLVPIQGPAATAGRLFALNVVGAFIWEQLVQDTERDLIVGRMVETFAVEEGQATSDLDDFLAELVEAGCLIAEPLSCP